MNQELQKDISRLNTELSAVLAHLPALQRMVMEPILRRLIRILETLTEESAKHG